MSESNWQRPLEIVLQAIYEPLQREQLRWAVIGSVASALQGCRFEPGDIDLLTLEPETVVRLAEWMRPYAPARSPSPPGALDWLSSQEMPVSIGPDPGGSVWHFTRWLIDGAKVEAAHIRPTESFSRAQPGAGIWEAGPELWPHVRLVAHSTYAVPVAPLEIQLQTNRGRGRTERVRELERVLQEKGCDRQVLRQSLAREYWEEFQELL
jgi:hypothetical protein